MTEPRCEHGFTHEHGRRPDGNGGWVGGCSGSTAEPHACEFTGSCGRTHLLNPPAAPEPSQLADDLRAVKTRYYTGRFTGDDFRILYAAALRAQRPMPTRERVLPQRLRDHLEEVAADFERGTHDYYPEGYQQVAKDIREVLALFGEPQKK